jgi:hypothetical protein
MTPRHAALIIALPVSLAACTAPNLHPDLSKPQTPSPLFDKIAALDTEVFSAFNACADPGQLQKHAEYFSPSVEFYHDNGGVTWTRDDMLANTKKYACGNFRRELVAASLRVYPIKNFGAIAQGVHRFCQTESGECDGAAEFVIVWRQEGSTWAITRVLSYGHRPA